MATDPDIDSFTRSIGAIAPGPGSPNYEKWRLLFKRQNYFRFGNLFLVVKISRSKKPFWGVGKEFIDLLNNLDNFALVLLCSPTEGWVFDKQEVNAHIRSQRWRLREADGNYKINPPLPDRSSFFSPEHFIKRFENNGPGPAT